MIYDYKLLYLLYKYVFINIVMVLYVVSSVINEITLCTNRQSSDDKIAVI